MTGTRAASIAAEPAAPASRPRRPNPNAALLSDELASVIARDASVGSHIGRSVIG
jgi:hypothetical protein